jgi:hypothetical protein
MEAGGGPGRGSPHQRVVGFMMVHTTCQGESGKILPKLHIATT